MDELDLLGGFWKLVPEPDAERVREARGAFMDQISISANQQRSRRAGSVPTVRHAPSKRVERSVFRPPKIERHGKPQGGPISSRSSDRVAITTSVQAGSISSISRRYPSNQSSFSQSSRSGMLWGVTPQIG